MFHRGYKPLLLAIIVAIVFLLCSLHCTGNNFIEPSGNPLEEPVVIRTTCYTGGGVTSTGRPPKKGVVAGAKEWEGMVACLYAYEYLNGKPVPTEYIGMFTILDTGAGIDTDGDGQGDSIKNGKSIDVYCESEEEIKEFQKKYGDYTLMILIDGDG